jgi:hypothetical protein
MEETTTNLTESSIRAAASVCDSLADEVSLPSGQHAEYLAMAERLRSIADEMADTDESGEPIPIPEDALTEESFAELLKELT